MSLDGKIATRTGESKWISSKKSRLQVHNLRNKLSGIMVGVNTVIKDDPELTCRIQNGSNPIRIIVDSILRIPMNSKVLQNNDNKTIIATTKRANMKNMQELLKKNIKVLIIEEKNGQVNLNALIKKLGENHTVILSSHILSEISAVCDHVFIISKGKLVASDATENLINLMSKNQEINLVLKSDEIGARGMLEKIVNVDKVTFEKSEEEKTVKAKVIAKANCDIREEIFELASAMHMPILEMHTVVKSLEDVFLELTGEGDEK